MQGFRSAGGLQRFSSVFSAVRNLFVPPNQNKSALATHFYRLQAIAAGRPRQACSPEINKARLLAVSSRYRDITVIASDPGAEWGQSEGSQKAAGTFAAARSECRVMLKNGRSGGRPWSFS
jgi:hypothetical protein